MKKSLWLLAVIAAVAVGSLSASAQCSSCGKDKKATAQAASCAKCGELKTSDKCCKPDAVKCAKCGLNAGSSGCKAKCCAEEKK
jgi:hypothetical protein